VRKRVDRTKKMARYQVLSVGPTIVSPNRRWCSGRAA
jgi:hypothetical protein